MKRGEISVQDRIWAERCLAMSRIYAAFAILGLVILFLFLIAGIVRSESVYWRTGVPTEAFTIVEHCLFLALILTYLIVSIAVMFAAPEFRQHKYAFMHGTLIGFSFPFSHFMIGESAAWLNAPSATFAGVSVLSAIMGGIVFCGIFTYWNLLSRPSAERITVSARWFSKGLQVAEMTMTLLWTVAVLSSAVCMVWLVARVPGQQGFALIINAIAYLTVLIYAYLVRLHYMRTHLALGALFGGSLAHVFMSAKWTFNMASRYEGASTDPWSTLYVATLSFNAAMASLTLPLLIAWTLMDAKSVSEREEPEGPEQAQEPQQPVAG